MNARQGLAAALAPFGPQLPLDELVVEMNRLYHSLEADIYDDAHPEVHQQLPPLWREMVRYILDTSPRAEWHVLDYGCGTGFAAEQLLANLPRGAIARLICYDPCPQMLERCRARVLPRFGQARFTSDLADVLSPAAAYNLLATNSVLHHLPDPFEAVRSLLPSLTADAVWLAGHEPSVRFYRNPHCAAAYERLRRERRRWRFLSPAKYAGALKSVLGLRRPSLHDRVAREAQEQGLFSRRPPNSLITPLVDFHVVLSAEGAGAGLGFDPMVLEEYFGGAWALAWLKSYAFMGNVYEGSLRGKWRRRCRGLKDQHPDDGANFCAVWRRGRCR